MKLKYYIRKHSDFPMRWSHKEHTRKTWSNHLNNQNSLNKHCQCFLEKPWKSLGNNAQDLQNWIKLILRTFWFWFSWFPLTLQTCRKCKRGCTPPFPTKQNFFMNPEPLELLRCNLCRVQWHASVIQLLSM